MTKSRSDLHEAARDYAERGWPVFPLIPRGKRPLTENGFKDATTDLKQIDRWWLLRPMANIGLPTGIAFDVLDIDGPEGMTLLREFPGVGSYRHDGPVSLTGKGWHCLFSPTGRANGAALLGEDSKLDFRGDGGYIAAPPSIHPLGHRYRWDPNRNVDTPLPEPTSWLFDLLDHRGIAEREEHVDRMAIIKSSTTRKALQAAYEIMPEQLPHDLRRRLGRRDIIEVAEEIGLQQLRAKGRYWQALCIFHSEDTPSLALYPANNTFYCYGCNAYGDSDDLLKREPMKR